MLYKNGMALCQAYYLADFAVYLAAGVKGATVSDEERRAIALQSAQQRSPTFDAQRDCNQSR